MAVIAFGVAPGIRSLAYCALEWDGEGQARVLDRDVMSRPRLLKGEPNAALLARRFNCHRLILTTVWDRHVPAVLSIGPPCDTSEPRRNAMIAGTIIAEFGKLMGAEIVRVSEVDLVQALQGDKKTLRAALGVRVGTVPRDRRAVLATGAAVYGLLERQVLEIS